LLSLPKAKLANVISMPLSSSRQTLVFHFEEIQGFNEKQQQQQHLNVPNLTGLRARTMKVYSMYSRRTLAQVRDTLEEMGVTHYVLEDSWCTRKTREGCQMPQIWDIEEPENMVTACLLCIVVDCDTFFICFFFYRPYDVMCSVKGQQSS